jgi:methionyl-tRNA formyltransferase
MSRVLFVVNEPCDYDFGPLIERHLCGWQTQIATTMPDDCSLYRLIVLWSYKRIIENIPEPNNVVIFHSSALPAGRGWAPIYHAIVENDNYYTISAILAAPEVDAGDIVLRVRFPMLPSYTATTLRRFDHEASIMGARRILERFRDRRIVGMPQRGPSTYRKRRYPVDNRIDVERRFRELIPMLRACEPSAPAFFEFDGVRYLVTVTPESETEFPEKIEFQFLEDVSEA